MYENVNRFSGSWSRKSSSAATPSQSAIRFLYHHPVPAPTKRLRRRISAPSDPGHSQVTFCVWGVLSPLLANIYLDPLDQELEKRGHKFCRYADDCNIYVGSEAAERTLASIGGWIEKHLRLKVNRDKSGKGKARERKFLGFRLNRQGQIEAAPEAIQRFKTKGRQMWRSCQSKTSEQLRDGWQRYVRGWWGYYRLAEERKPIFRLEGWIRRHIRKCFWLRWHGARGREQALRRLGVHPRLLRTVRTSRGAWFMAATSTVHAGLKTVTLRRYGFWMPSDLAARG
jgi:RNA-directed DNA polymerase